MNRKGFSLLEIALVLTIVGIMLYGTMSLYAISTASAKITSNNNTLDVIERALRLHFQTKGDLPCPADATLELGNANFGLSQEVTEGTCPVANDRLAIAGASGGVIPTRTLNLPDTYMFDGWGNRITYVVSDACVNNANWDDPTVPVLPAVSTDCVDAANLTIQDNSGASERTARAAYVLISHGDNGIGAWRRNGGANRIPSVATTSAHELENAQINTAGTTTSADLIYRDDFIKDWDEIATADYFDDFVRWKTEAQISDED